jgi:hypothetical protein
MLQLLSNGMGDVAPVDDDYHKDLSFRHVLKLKKDDGEVAPYYRLKEEKQYSDLQVSHSRSTKSFTLAEQFKESPTRVPIHAIILAVALFLIGSVMITLGALMLTGRIQTQVTPPFCHRRPFISDCCL